MPASAAELIGKAIKLNDRVGEYHYNIALAWRALNRMDEVAAHLERAVELRPDHAMAHLNLGNVRREQGRLADAAACYERASALNPNSAAPRIQSRQRARRARPLGRRGRRLSAGLGA